MTRLFLVALIFVQPVLAAEPRADVLLIERVGARSDIALPARGSLMNQVEAQFGAPQRRHPPVGGGLPQQPPITRWDYPEFSVYFENNHVVNAVVIQALPNEQGPKPPASHP